MIQSALLNRFPGLIHGFSSAAEGNMSLASGREEEVLQHRRKFSEDLDFDLSSLVLADQVHGDHVFVIDSQDRGKGAVQLNSPLGQGDALCTNVFGVPIGVLVADCAAVYCYDPEAPAIGLAHAGWRGAAAGVVPRLIETMKAQYGCLVENLNVWISPCICFDRFEVGREVIDLMLEKQPEVTKEEGWFRSRQEKPGKFLLDLKELVRRQTVIMGISASQVEVSPHCTYSDDSSFFSYRRSGRGCGHMMGVLALREGGQALEG